MIDKFWNLAIRELYYIGFMPKDDMISIYGTYNNDLINDYEYRKYYVLVIEILKNTKLMLQLVREEIAVVSDLRLPEKKLFKKMWLSYLLDCIILGSLDLTELDEYESRIDFSNNVWSDEETSTAMNIIDKLRIGIVNKNPTAIEYMENLSFDMLMDINKIG
jgi:hypothetical protein